jgi:hypothetical protein
MSRLPCQNQANDKKRRNGPHGRMGSMKYPKDNTGNSQLFQKVSIRLIL